MIVTTTNNIEGYKIVAYKGLVRGLIVRTPNIVQSFLGSLKNIVGGKIGAFAQMCETTRAEAFDLLIKHAEAMGANAIVAARYDTSDLGQMGATEVLCYGTAVVIEEERH